MSITINLDEATQKRLEFEAMTVGKTLEQYVLDVLTSQSQAGQATHVPRKRNLGFAANRGIWMSDDFDAPLDEFKDYM